MPSVSRSGWLPGTAQLRGWSHGDLDGFPSLLHSMGLVAVGAVELLSLPQGDPSEVTERRIGSQLRISQGGVPDRPGGIPGVSAEGGSHHVESTVGDTRVGVDITAGYVTVHVRRLVVMRI